MLQVANTMRGNSCLSLNGIYVFTASQNIAGSNVALILEELRPRRYRHTAYERKEWLIKEEKEITKNEICYIGWMSSASLYPFDKFPIKQTENHCIWMNIQSKNCAFKVLL